MCAGGDGDIDPIVDENPRTSPADSLDRPSHQRQQGVVRQVPFANLNEMYTGPGGRNHPADQRSLGVRPQAPAIGNHADHRAHGEDLFFGCG